MKKWFLLCFLFPLALVASVDKKGDFQIWNTDGLQLRLSNKSSICADMEFRYGDDSSTLFYKHYHFVLNYSPNRFITIGPGFRFVSHRFEKKWAKEKQPFCDLTLFFANSPQVIISDRNRVAYRILPKELGGKNRYLYRNRLLFLFPWRMGRMGLNPYFSDEIFWQQAHGFFQNRVNFGLIIPRNNRAFFDVFYSYRSLKNLQDKWVYHNILGLGAYFHF